MKPLKLPARSVGRFIDSLNGLVGRVYVTLIIVGRDDTSRCLNDVYMIITHLLESIDVSIERVQVYP